MTWTPAGGVGVFDRQVFDPVVFHTVFGWTPAAVVTSGWVAEASL